MQKTQRMPGKPQRLRLLRAGCLAALLGAGILAVGACSDKSARLGEAETLQYKRGIIAEHRSELSPSQAEKLLYHPARTRGEIDAYLEELKAEYHAEQEAERARWTELREIGESIEAEATSENTGGSGGGDGDGE